MPFTPFHLGPALMVGLPFRKYLPAPTFLVANVIVDVEPLVVLLLGLQYPLHGYFHTFLAAFPIGFALSWVMARLETVLHPLYTALSLEADKSLNQTSFVVTGVSGIGLHVLLDSSLYTDIQPFYPIPTNPLHNPAFTTDIYRLSMGMGIVGVIYYASLLAFSIHRRAQRR